MDADGHRPSRLRGFSGWKALETVSREEGTRAGLAPGSGATKAHTLPWPCTASPGEGLGKSGHLH